MAMMVETLKSTDEHKPKVTQPRQVAILGYSPPLDGLRAIAVILVMLTHANFQLGGNGILGVDMFFTLSGFLITTLLLEEHHKRSEISMLGFYVRRAFRLFPALYVVLAAALLYAFFFNEGMERSKIILEVISASLYLYNIAWMWDWDGPLLRHMWSLAVEEQFYLVWPWVLIFTLRFNGLRWLIWGLIIFILMSLTLKLTGLSSGLVKSLIHEGIFIGCLTALLRWTGKQTLKIPDFLMFCSLTAVVVIGVFPIGYYVELKAIGPALISLLVALIIVGLIKQPQSFTGKLLSMPMLIGIGKISYALYLWHVPIFLWFKWHSVLSPWQSFMLKFIVSFLLAWLSWVLLEKKASQRGHRLSKWILNRS